VRFAVSLKVPGLAHIGTPGRGPALGPESGQPLLCPDATRRQRGATFLTCESQLPCASWAVITPPGSVTPAATPKLWSGAAVASIPGGKWGRISLTLPRWSNSASCARLPTTVRTSERDVVLEQDIAHSLHRANSGGSEA